MFATIFFDIFNCVCLQSSLLIILLYVVSSLTDNPIRYVGTFCYV
jgi:hypothetical protein